MTDQVFCQMFPAGSWKWTSKDLDGIGMRLDGKCHHAPLGSALSRRCHRQRRVPPGGQPDLQLRTVWLRQSEHLLQQHLQRRLRRLQQLRGQQRRACLNRQDDHGRHLDRHDLADRPGHHPRQRVLLLGPSAPASTAMATSCAAASPSASTTWCSIPGTARLPAAPDPAAGGAVHRLHHHPRRQHPFRLGHPSRWGDAATAPALPHPRHLALAAPWGPPPSGHLNDLR